MQHLHITPLETPLRYGPVAMPVDWISDWLKETHGGRRLHAVAEIYERLHPLGVGGCALLGGSWLSIDPVLLGVERDGPWTEPLFPVWAEHAGTFPPGWLRRVASALLHQFPEPHAVPRAYVVADAEASGIVIDPSLAGRRPGLVVVGIPAALGPARIERILHDPAVAWLVHVAAGLLRGDMFRTQGVRLADLLVPSPMTTHDTDRPMNPQEVVARVSRALRRMVQGARSTFEVATVGVFLPDPDDEHVYCLAGAGLDDYAYDGGIVPDKPVVAEVGFGLTGAIAMGAAFDPKGGPLAIRVLERREEVIARYRDLGFEGDLERSGAFQSERFTDADVKDAARKGPWVFTAQQLPPTLSPSRRNLVVRYQGRMVDPVWATDDERRRVSVDRRSQMSTLSLRLFGDVVGLLTEGLGRWRDGLRNEVMRELTAPAVDLDSLAQRLAHWLSARAVTFFEHQGGMLTLAGWSSSGPRPDLAFDLQGEPVPAEELRLLHAPLYPRRSSLDAEGFLGWTELGEALGFLSENVGTVPIGRGPEPWGLLRVDGVMSLFGGHLSRRSVQRGLCHHRPTVTPHHVRPVLEDVAQLTAISVVAQRRVVATSELGDWQALLARTRSGLATREEAEALVKSLRSRARTKGAAAEIIGLHRNTFRRQLDELGQRLGGPIW